MKREFLLPAERDLNTILSSEYGHIKNYLDTHPLGVNTFIQSYEEANIHQIGMIMDAGKIFSQILGNDEVSEQLSAYRALCFALETSYVALGEEPDINLVQYMKELREEVNPKDKITFDYQAYLMNRRIIDCIVSDYAPAIDAADGRHLHTVTEQVLVISYMLIDQAFRSRRN